MIPINGFFEYGIAAVLGIAVMMIFVGWGLATDEVPGEPEALSTPEGEVPESALEFYQKAA